MRKLRHFGQKGMHEGMQINFLNFIVYGRENSPKKPKCYINTRKVSRHKKNCIKMFKCEIGKGVKHKVKPYSYKVQE